MTGHVTFDRAARDQYIGKGNVWADVQHSSYIRHKQQTQCNSREFPEGHLRDFDLKPFRSSLIIPLKVERKILEQTESDRNAKGVILYCFFHYNWTPQEKHHRVIHGWVLTTYDHDLIDYWVTGPTHKSRWVLMECAREVCNKTNRIAA